MELIEHKYPSGVIEWLEPSQICKCGIYKKANLKDACLACEKFIAPNFKTPKKPKNENNRKRP